ncbi:MAG: hypothetical protein K6A35_03675 [bacterium]|nr:hypothetical protein [bacterium]
MDNFSSDLVGDVAGDIIDTRLDSVDMGRRRVGAGDGGLRTSVNPPGSGNINASVIIVTAILLILGLFMLKSASGGVEQLKETKAWQNEELNISLELPGGFEELEAKRSNDVAFGNRKCHAAIMISINDMLPNKKLSSAKQLKLFVKHFSSDTKGTKLVSQSQKEAVVAGRKAIIVNYSSQSKDGEFEDCACFLIKRKKIYTFFCMAEKGKHKEVHAAFEKMMDSIKWLDENNSVSGGSTSKDKRK